MNLLYRITIIFLLFIFTTSKVKTENSMHLGFSGGLAIPNDRVSQFYDDAKKYVQMDLVGTWGRYILDEATNTGYNFKVQARIDLSDNFTFVPSIGVSRFTDCFYDLVVPFSDTDTISAITQSTTNVVPISIGINGYLFKKFLSPYLSADLVYNYIAYSYDIIWNDNIALPIATSTSMSRLGYSVGAGLDIDLYLVSLNVEAKFHTINIIKHNSYEPAKNYFTFLLGIIF